MSAFLSRVDIFADDEKPDEPPRLHLTVTDESEALGYHRQLEGGEFLHGLCHESVKDKTKYVQEMISLLVRVIEAEYDVRVDGSVLEPEELHNLMNRYDKRGETE